MTRFQHDPGTRAQSGEPTRHAYESSCFACLGLTSAGSWTASNQRDFIMGAENKAANKVTEVRGKIKKKAGQATDDTDLEA
jgi:hypothetical protein